jgi:N-acetylglucosamine kinase-like BadF-type ATPase
MTKGLRILIADSGSSKTEWKIIDNGVNGESLFSTGINPYFLTSEEIFGILGHEIGDLSGRSFSNVLFYGSGCNSPVKEDIVRNAIDRFFVSDKTFIGSDLLAAARSLCQNDPGIACIMGTGSNSCYYDGKRIVSNIPPLGYILGDEGGGAVLGRKLISSILKKQVPESIRENFLERYQLTTAEILDNVYTKPFPNRFLGQFSRFLSDNIDIPELREIVDSSFEDFIRRNILQYPESGDLPIHFTGSIAFHFSELLIEQLYKANLTPGVITHTPIAGLVQYHLNHMQQI